MALKIVNDRLRIAPQLNDAGIRNAAAQGVRKIINNRPDREEPGQPPAADNRQLAAGLGLAYAHVPVVPGQISEAQVRAFQKEIASADGPVLAHCKSGTRSLTLYAIGEGLDGRMTGQEIAELGTRLGVDLSGARRWLDSHS